MQIYRGTGGREGVGMAVQALYSHTTLFKCCAGTKAKPIAQIVPGDTTNGAD